MSRLYFIGILLFLFPLCGKAQSIDTEFGKNRVQYHDDFKKWWSYETENFITYWYGKGRNIAQTVVQIAEMDYNEIQNIMEHRINDKIEIIVFLDVSDMKQSNIGTEDTFVSFSDQTKTIANKMFVYFDGNHVNLRRQIREGVSNVFLNSMFYGGSLQEMVKSAIKLNVPAWFERGIISYAGSAWDELLDDELRDIWLREDKDYKNFDKLSDDYPKIAGHSFWYFVDQLYGKSTIANILYLTRINRDLDESFLFVLGTKFEEIITEWEAFYNEKYAQEENKFVLTSGMHELDLKNKDHAPVSYMRISPDGNYLAYLHNELGKVKMHLLDLRTGEEKQIFKYGYKNSFQDIDYNYPIFAWHPSGSEITLIYEHRDKIRMRKIFLANDEYMEQTIPENFHRIFSVDYINDLDYLFSASTDGFSDLYVYYSKSRQDARLTEDFYDDLDASYVEMNGSKGVLFSSNRNNLEVTTEKLDTILPLGNYNIYFFPFEEDTDSLQQLTFSNNYDNRHPFLIDQEHISYLNQSSGIKNLRIQNITNNRPASIVTNLDRNIIRYHSNPSSDLFVYSLYSDEGYRTYLDTISTTDRVNPHLTNFAKKRSATNNTSSIGIFPLQDEDDQIEEPMQDGFLFQSEFDDPAKIEELKQVSTNQDNFRKTSSDVYQSNTADVIEFVSARAVAARTKFKIEDVSTKLDNQVLFEGLESFAGDDKQLVNVPMGFLMKATVKDLFEDYEIEGGIRIPTRFNGSEQFLILDNNKMLLDHRFAIYRKTESERLSESVFPIQKNKRTTLLGQYRVRYPFDIHHSVRATASLRFDKLFYLSSDAFSSNIPDENEKRLGLRLEYVFDNTMDIDLNVKHGTRYKVYTEFLNRFNLEFDDFKVDLSKGFTGVVGLDFRHYIPVLNHTVLALRAAGASSFGSEKILYYIGGSDGSVISKFNQNIPVPQDRNFGYKVVAPHLRGFDFNIRNGSTFALINSELRVPILKYFSRKSTMPSFFRNFQIVGFVDVGTAWVGLSPNSADNPINTISIDQPPVLQVKVRYYKDPLVMGYGTGLRASVLGYFIRLDYAWGVESRQVQDPKFYFSIGKDF